MMIESITITYLKQTIFNFTFYYRVLSTLQTLLEATEDKRGEDEVGIVLKKKFLKFPQISYYKKA